MSLIGKRYAEALVEISFSQNSIDLHQEELNLAVSTYSEQLELQNFLLSPGIKVENKQAVISKIFSGKISPVIINFLMLLVEKGRIKYLPDMYKEFVDIADEKRNILHMTIVSPFPLDELQVNKLSEKYRTLYDSNSVKTEIKLDKSLIGGVKIIIGDKVIDATTAGRLKALHNALEEE